MSVTLPRPAYEDALMHIVFPDDPPAFDGANLTVRFKARVLREAGGAAIERASGRWQQGRWADFDPRKTLEPLSEFNQKRA